MNTYHINEHDEVVPVSGGRVSNDTRSYRDATELELSQREEIAELEKEVSQLKHYLDSTLDEVDDFGNISSKTYRELREALS
jgi:hypothetical protein